MSLLQNAVDAVGGLKRWRSCDEVVATVSAGGPVFSSRFSFIGRRKRTVRVSTKTPRTIFECYPGPGRRGIFTRDLVWIESDSGHRIAERRSPRAAFRSWRHCIWWDHLDFLYFGGYASSNYFSIPFLLADNSIKSDELEPWEESGERWRRLEVHFPENIPTHSQTQVFYFDNNFILRRIDYNPEIYAAWARAAHYCFSYARFSGLLVPTRRSVFARKPNGASLTWPRLLWIEVADVQFN